MKILLLIVLGLSSTCWAQVKVQVRFEQDQYLKDESLPVLVRVTNVSGRPLAFGDSGWLKFTVEDSARNEVLQSRPLALGDPFVLQPAETVIRRVDLLSGYRLPEPDSYRVTGKLTIEPWQEAFVSSPARVVVTSGLILGMRDYGWTNPEGETVLGRYTLVQAPLQRRLRLYLRISTFESAEATRVYPLGTIVSFAKPETVVDPESRLHVLFQSGPRRFDYCVVTPGGRLHDRKLYESGPSRPALEVTDGVIGIKGGTLIQDPVSLPRVSD